MAFLILLHHRHQSLSFLHYLCQLELLTYFVIVLSDRNIAHMKSACLFQVSNGGDVHCLNESIVRFNSELQKYLNELAVNFVISIKFQILSVKCCY